MPGIYKSEYVVIEFILTQTTTGNMYLSYVFVKWNVIWLWLLKLHTWSGIKYLHSSGLQDVEDNWW